MIWIKKYTTRTSLAQKLRRNQTEAEKKIWSLLRNSQAGYKFRRQFPIDPYIVDFICVDKKLVIEIDGGQHTEEKDQARDAFLKAKGYRILRFWNNEVLDNNEGVAQVIREALASPHPGPLPTGEGK